MGGVNGPARSSGKEVKGVRNGLERLLEIICIVLMVGLAVLVVLAVIYRTAGSSLTWYDEVAAIMLAWLTYYGAALAALRRAHLGFPGLYAASPPALRLPMLIVGEILFISFFVILAWYGWQVIVLLYGDTLTSLPWVSVSFTQSIIPIGCALITLCQLSTLPERFREARLGLPLHDEEHQAIEAAARDTDR
jgi:TRAP-type C4-dicarboxylate transport system permease small subunit